MTDKTPIRIKSAGYGGYSANFSDYYFGAPMVAHSVQNIKKHFGNTIPPLKWGAYQKWAPDDPNDPNNWNRDNSGGPVLFDNWDSAVEEAREDMAKLPPFKGDDGPDPDQPGMKKHTMLEHLDRVVTVALLEKYQIGNNPPYSGIPVEVVVDYQAKHWRRHKIRTVWERENNHDPKYNCKKLTIHMTCPNGGWIGTALWKNYDGSQGPFTRYMATYAVPPKPANNAGQIVFIFNGLESIPDGNNVPAILQPVLQWTNENGGTWAIRSWYVPASYTPSFNQMPALNDVKPFTTVDQPAWTAATPVNPGDVLLGIITGDGANYTSQFQKGGAVVGATTLNVTNIATLTYPVAVIEAYMPPVVGQSKPPQVPSNGLPSPVTMTNVDLACTNGDPRPQWDTGQTGTNTLKRYTTVAQYNAGTGTSTITFTAKQSLKPAETDPDWAPETTATFLIRLRRFFLGR